MQPGSQRYSELNSLLEDPADERCWLDSARKHKHNLARLGTISMSYLPSNGYIASLFVNSRVSRDPGGPEDDL